MIIKFLYTRVFLNFYICVRAKLFNVCTHNDSLHIRFINVKPEIKSLLHIIENNIYPKWSLLS